MANHTLKRRFGALGTVLGLGIALTLTSGAGPAYASAQLEISKTHSGDFARGGTGTYIITVANRGDATTFEGSVMSDTLPQGITVAATEAVALPTGLNLACTANPERTVLQCDTDALPAYQGYTLEVRVNIADTAPCAVTNTARVTAGIFYDAASDPTRITGPGCDNPDGAGGGGSILPVDLSGVAPIFNNNTTNNFGSPGSTITANQNLTASAAP
ncbi:hypothetical protein ACQKM2_14210 [Streptomyces sp. NPDC004126]|uniref:hypothetical protein n=1 Tax=Streptomyces sp. NPDC004126 TaxID=3390695 RepID=UPI003D0523B0